MTFLALPYQPVTATGGYLRLELPRTLRNRRFIVLAVAFPVAFYLLFTRVLTGGAVLTADERAFFMVSMAAYGAIGASLSVAVRVSMERSNGWTRMLRVTPLPALGYVITKLATAYLTAVPSILLVMAAGFFVNGVTLPLSTWLAVFVLLSLGVLPFAALGVAIGYAFDESSAQMVFTISFVGLAILGGLWTPISQFPDSLATIGRMLPSYHFANLGWSAVAGRAPDPSDVLALVAYGAVFTGIVAWRFRVSELRTRG
jgi:ABC-2 type transport system permease protein